VLAGNLKVAIVVARTEAAARGDALVGTEHLLLGLLQQGEGSAAAALRAAGASLRILRSALDVLAPTDLCSVKPSQITMTTRAAAALERAAIAAHRDRSERVTDAHLLRALLEHPESGASFALEATGVSRKDVLAALMRGAGERVSVNAA
jgi:ATP-dependent Clp protease ATP-binding subunit ClpC